MQHSPRMSVVVPTHLHCLQHRCHCLLTSCSRCGAPFLLTPQHLWLPAWHSVAAEGRLCSVGHTVQSMRKTQKCPCCTGKSSCLSPRYLLTTVQGSVCPLPTMAQNNSPPSEGKTFAGSKQPSAAQHSPHAPGSTAAGHPPPQTKQGKSSVRLSSNKDVFMVCLRGGKERK